MTNEMVINGQTYEFSFGMKFLRDIDKRKVREDGGIEQNIGLIYYIISLTESSLEALFDVLYLANAGYKPRLEQAEYDRWIEDTDTDVEEVFKTVLGFLKSSNCTKIQTEKALKIAEMSL